MNRSQRREILETIGFVGLIASLLFVGIETRSSTEQARLANQSLQNDSYQNVLAAMGEMSLVLATNEEFHRLFTVGEKAPSELTEDEWSRFTYFNFARIGTWEYIYLGTQENSVPTVIWEAFDPFFSRYCLHGREQAIHRRESDCACPFIHGIPRLRCLRALLGKIALPRSERLLLAVSSLSPRIS